MCMAFLLGYLTLNTAQAARTEADTHCSVGLGGERPLQLQKQLEMEEEMQ